MKKLDVIITMCIFFALCGAISMAITWLSTISTWLSLGAIAFMGIIALVCAYVQELRNEQAE